MILFLRYQYFDYVTSDRIGVLQMVTSYQRNQITSNTGVLYSSLIKTAFLEKYEKNEVQHFMHGDLRNILCKRLIFIISL
jgi:hypothetical protein